MLALGVGINPNVGIWSVDGSAPPRMYSGHPSRADSVALSPNNEIVAAAFPDGKMRLWPIMVTS